MSYRKLTLGIGNGIGEREPHLLWYWLVVLTVVSAQGDMAGGGGYRP